MRGIAGFFGPWSDRRLNGIFAFAVWDRALRRLFIARDQLGVKPLYYSALPHGFLFASELKALTVCPDLSRDVDVGSVANHLAFVWSSTASTMLKSVRKLRPGHYGWIDASGRTAIERYYEIPLPPPRCERVEPAIRVPLLDPRRVAFAMNVPVSQKIGLWQTKRILPKATAARLNRAVLRRAKQGFGVPLRAWMAGPARDLVAKMTSPVVAARGLFDPSAVARLRNAFDQNRGDVVFILFTLVRIEVWCRQLSYRPALASTDARCYLTLIRKSGRPVFRKDHAQTTG